MVSLAPPPLLTSAATQQPPVAAPHAADGANATPAAAAAFTQLEMPPHLGRAKAKSRPGRRPLQLVARQAEPVVWSGLAGARASSAATWLTSPRAEAVNGRWAKPTPAPQQPSGGRLHRQQQHKHEGVQGWQQASKHEEQLMLPPPTTHSYQTHIAGPPLLLPPRTRSRLVRQANRKPQPVLQPIAVNDLKLELTNQRSDTNYTPHSVQLH